MKKRISILMMAAITILGGCSKDSNKQDIPKVDRKAIERVTEQILASVPIGNEITKIVEVTEQAIEPEVPMETIAEVEQEQQTEPVIQETPTPQPQITKAQQAAEAQQEVPQPPTPEPEAPTPEPEAPAPQLPAPKSIYDYEFDVEAIRAELIAIGQSRGLTHVTTDDGNVRTPDNSSWAMPITASQSFQGEALKRSLHDYVSSMPDLIQMAGGGPITYFTIYVEPVGNGSYTFYFMY